MSELSEDWWMNFIQVMLISFGAMSARLVYDQSDCPHHSLISEWREINKVEEHEIRYGCRRIPVPYAEMKDFYNQHLAVVARIRLRCLRARTVRRELQQGDQTSTHTASEETKQIHKEEKTTESPRKSKHARTHDNDQENTKPKTT